MDKFDLEEIDSKGYSIYDPSRACDWIPTLERNWIPLEERLKKLNMSHKDYKDYLRKNKGKK